MWFQVSRVAPKRVRKFTVVLGEKVVCDGPNSAACCDVAGEMEPAWRRGAVGEGGIVAETNKVGKAESR